MQDTGRSIELRCIICSSNEFVVVNSDVQELIAEDKFTVLKCCNCGRATTKDQLTDENK